MMPNELSVLVIGAGPAGVAAAVSAARLGAHVLLVEQEGRVGGLATAGLVAPCASGFFRDEQVVRGVFQEVADRLVETGGGIGHVLYAGTSRGWGGAYMPFDPAILERVELDMLEEAGVRLMLRAQLVGARAASGTITSVDVYTKAGAARLSPRFCVDATGDADLAALAGFRCRKGREADGLMQPVTLMMRVGGVDIDLLRDYVRTHPDEFAWTAEPCLPAGADSSRTNETLVIGSGFRGEIRKARDAGELYFGRSRFVFATGVRPGEVFLNATRVNGIDGTSSADLTRAEVDGRRQAMSLFRFVSHRIPGFARSWLIATGATVGVRETRRIVGEYELGLADVLGGARFADAIAVGGYPVDVHEVTSEWGQAVQKESVWTELPAPYDVPFRCLIPRGGANLLAAGRCISASHEALGSARVQPIAMATGEAAGAAAALACAEGARQIGALDVGKLRRQLVRQGVYLRPLSGEDEQSGLSKG